MNKRPTSLDAFVRAKRWKLGELAQQKAQLDAADVQCRAREQGLAALLSSQAQKRDELLIRGSFRAADLAVNRLSLAAIANDLGQVRSDLGRIDAAVQQLTGEMAAERTDKALLEHVLANWNDADQASRRSRDGREADALTAARPPLSPGKD